MAVEVEIYMRELEGVGFSNGKLDATGNWNSIK